MFEIETHLCLIFHLMDFPLIQSQTIPRESLLDIEEKSLSFLGWSKNVKQA